MDGVDDIESPFLGTCVFREPELEGEEITRHYTCFVSGLPKYFALDSPPSRDELRSISV
jgi:hypothetical protein